MTFREFAEFYSVNIIFDFRCSVYMQNNKIEIEVQLYRSSLIFLLNRIMTPLAN